MPDRDDPPPAAVRVDRWLWAARVFRSRSLAADACNGGKVEVNGSGAKPHKLVRPGDRLEVTTPAGKRQLRIVAAGERRGSPPAAQQLYDDLTPPRPPAEAFGRRDRGSGRPTKRERRRIDRERRW